MKMYEFKNNTDNTILEIPAKSFREAFLKVVDFYADRNPQEIQYCGKKEVC